MCEAIWFKLQINLKQIKKRKTKEKEEWKRKEGGSSSAQPASTGPASSAEPRLPFHARSPQSRPSVAARTCTAADKPGPLIRHHAPHAVTTHQARDDPTSLVSTVASSSSRPRVLPARPGADQCGRCGPGGHARSMTLFPLAPCLCYRTRAVGCAARVTTARSPYAIGGLGAQL